MAGTLFYFSEYLSVSGVLQIRQHTLGVPQNEHPFFLETCVQLSGDGCADRADGVVHDALSGVYDDRAGSGDVLFNLPNGENPTEIYAGTGES